MKKVNLPTALTITRIALAIFIILFLSVFFILDEFGIIVQANRYYDVFGLKISRYMCDILELFIIASITDFLDGYIARKYNLITDLGKFLDPLADKMLINSLFIFLCFNFKSLNADGYQVIPWFCVVIMIVRDLAVDGMRFMAAKNNVIVAANFWGKAKTVLQMVTIVVILLNGFPFAYLDKSFPKYLKITDLLCYITTLVSVIGGIKYLKDNKKVFKN